MKFSHPLATLVAPVLLLILLAAPSVLAFKDEEWRPIDPAHLALKTPVVEKDADAEVIFWEVRIDDGERGELEESHYVRVKIFTERGKELYSKIEIPFFNFTKIKDLAARTIKADGAIIELKKEDIFEQTKVQISGLKLKHKSFAVPGIEPGVIIEYRWREVVDGGGGGRFQLNFQREIPVQNVTYYVKPFSGIYGMRYMPFQVPDSVRFTKDKDGFHKISMSNVPAFREEPRMPPRNQVRPWILIYYSSNVSQSPASYWRNLGQRYHEFFKEWTKVNDDVRKAATQIMGDAATPEQKLDRLLEYCRTKIKNVSDDASGLTPEERKKVKDNKKPSDTLKRGVADGGEINMVFAALASAAGFETRLAFVGDRSDIFFDPSFANASFISPSVIAVRVGSQWRFYSPGYNYVPAGMLRWQQEGQQALLADETEPAWVKTPISAPQLSLEKRTAKLRLDEDGTLEGDVRIEYTGQFAIERKEYNDDESPAEREEILRKIVKNRMDTAEVTNIRVENVQDPAKPFVYEYHIRIPGYAQRTGKRVFLQPAFFHRGIPALFTQSQRQHSIYFHYPWSEEDEVTIELPAGYSLDSPDAPAPFRSEKVSDYKATIGISKDQRTLVYKRSFYFGDNEAILFPPNMYQPLRNYFDRVYKADNHTITLKQGAATAQAPAK
ncbi:MAG: DUF3857 and transglutaminase domain-containing protein [Pyrinomonadaceae bacterium]|nr:DUF3857 and transglutaminase domain-containing protein [Pyrinomonadaceae bacterium]